MKTISQYISENLNRIKSIKDLEKFISKFPDNATSWRYANDEIRDICKTLREYLKEYDNIDVEPLDYKSFKTPSEWNVNSKDFIRVNIKKLSKNTLERFLKDLDETFCHNES